jgi:hypothetical protein
MFNKAADAPRSVSIAANSANSMRATFITTAPRHNSNRIIRVRS